jgi:hypothetical protein
MYSLVTELVAERKKYGAMMSNDQCVALLNAVLWNDRARGGYRLAEKNGGNNGKRHDGKRCSVDGLVWTVDRTYIDVLVDAGGISRPTWQVHAIGQTAPSGNPYRPHTGPLLEAIAPAGEPQPEPPPPPTPPQPDTPNQEHDHSGLVADNELVAFARGVDALFAAMREDLANLAAKVAALEAAKYRVKGETSRVWGHGHDVELPVEREP